MINLWQTEFCKLRKNRSFWLICLAMTVIYGFMFTVAAIEWWGIHDQSLYVVDLKEYGAIHTLKSSLFYNFFISVLATAYINADQAIGVVKNQIICGYNRSKLYLSKWIMFALASGFIMAVIPFCISFLVIFINGQAHIYNQSNILFLIKSHLLFACGIAVYSSLVMLIATMVKESGKTILYTAIISIMVYIVEWLLVPYFPIVERLYALTVFSQGFAAFAVDTPIARHSLILLMNLAGLLLWGCHHFKKEEIK